MKFFQVLTFYESYLAELYAKNPHLERMGFSEQTEALLADAFAASHYFAPAMQKLDYDARLVVANCPQSQSAWLAENGKVLVNQATWKHEVLRSQIDAFAPDILLLSDPITFDSSFVRSLNKQPSLVIGWRAANIPAATDWTGFDLIISNSTVCLRTALDLGARATEFFAPGYPAQVNELLLTTPKTHDVVFSGQLTPEHEYRCKCLNDVSKALLGGKADFSIAYHIASSNPGALPAGITMHDHGAVWGLDMYRALKGGRIVLNAHIDMAKNDSGNMRLFEATGVGSFILTDYKENLSRYFEPGQEIETFRNSEELVEKIIYYLDHPEERELIAWSGQQRCLRDYSIERRAEELDQIIRKNISRKTDHECHLSVERLRDEASRLIEQSDYHRALDLLIRAKSLKISLQGLDMLRAVCFFHMSQQAGATEALREELRHFPENEEARQMLDKLDRQTCEAPLSGIEDQEFRQLFTAIRPYTMLSVERLHSIFSLAKHICEQNIPGNFVECGVAAGGSSALLAYVIKRYSKIPRRLFSFDSFSGMPAPTDVDTHAGLSADNTGWGTGTCAAPEQSVREICSKLGAADVLTTIKGYFEETLPAWRDRVGMIAFLHLDGDWYESTKSILANLYDRIINNGILQVDDYGHWDGCRKAIHEFETGRNIKFMISVIDATGVWFPKPDRFPANPLVPEKMIADFNEIDPFPKGIEVQMSLNERFQLYYTVQNMLPRRSLPLRFVEVGSYAGGSLALTVLALKKTMHQIEGFSIEPGGQPTLARILNAIGKDVTLLPLFSYQAVPRLKEAFLDGNMPEFIFIDGDHGYEGVRRDIIDYYPLLAPGGIILFHDWLPPLDNSNREAILAHHGGEEPGIRQACSEILEEFYGLKPLELPLLYPTDPTQTQAHIPIIPGVYSTLRAYRKPAQ